MKGIRLWSKSNFIMPNWIANINGVEFDLTASFAKLLERSNGNPKAAFSAMITIMNHLTGGADDEDLEDDFRQWVEELVSEFMLPDMELTDDVPKRLEKFYMTDQKDTAYSVFGPPQEVSATDDAE